MPRLRKTSNLWQAMCIELHQKAKYCCNLSRQTDICQKVSSTTNKEIAGWEKQNRNVLGKTNVDPQPSWEALVMNYHGNNALESYSNPFLDQTWESHYKEAAQIHPATVMVTTSCSYPSQNAKRCHETPRIQPVMITSCCYTSNNAKSCMVNL